MRLEEVLENLKNEFGDAVLESEFAFEDLSILITNESYFELVKFLKTQNSFDQLADTTAVHYPDKDKPFQNVVHLFSNLHNLRIRIKGDF
jgi:NADH-quinone oxidoreductase subunit C